MTEHVMAAVAPLSRALSRPHPVAQPEPEPLRVGWGSLLATLAARAYLAFLLTLMAAAVLPALGTWNAYVVKTGSMQPAIEAGDVVVASPFTAAGGEVPLGRVMVFTNPVFGTAPSAERVLVHRVIQRNDNGTYATRGDQNRSNDSSPVTADAFTGRGRLLVPMVGFPILWWQQHSWAALALWSVGTALAVALAFRHTDADRRRAQPARRRRVVDLFRTGHRGGATTSFFRGSGSATAGLSVGATTLVGCLLFSAAGASFSAETRNSGNGWSAASVLRSPYDTSVLSNTPTIYYRVDEPSGSTALDTSGAGRNGTYTAISAYAQTGAMVTNPDKSVCTTGGGGRLVSGGTTTSNPTTFSLEIWFKTTTTAGGKLIGFESTQASTSSKFDRHVYMNNTGRLVYGGWGSSPKTITTSAAYNNGTWHLLTLTAAPNGSTQRSSLYIDGVLSATGSTTAVTSYTGWWRAGYGALASGSGYPSSANFTGCLDNIAVYPSELSAAQVAAHYNAR